MCLILHIFHLDTPYLREQGCEDSWLFFEAKKGPVNNNVWDKLPYNILYRWRTEEWIWSFEGIIPIEMNRITGSKYFQVPICRSHPTWTYLWSNPGLLFDRPMLTIWSMPLLLYFNALASRVHDSFFLPESFLQCCLSDMPATCSTASVSLIFHHPDNSLWLMFELLKLLWHFGAREVFMIRVFWLPAQFPCQRASFRHSSPKVFALVLSSLSSGHHRLTQLKPMHDMLSFHNL
jgi:hypothetical protein